MMVLDPFPDAAVDAGPDATVQPAPPECQYMFLGRTGLVCEGEFILVIEYRLVDHDPGAVCRDLWRPMVGSYATIEGVIVDLSCDPDCIYQRAASADGIACGQRFAFDIWRAPDRDLCPAQTIPPTRPVCDEDAGI